jgi:Peptidase MA superfamily
MKNFKYSFGVFERSPNQQTSLSLRFPFRCKAISFLIFLITFSHASVAQNPTGIAWHYHSTPRFVIAYREQDQTLAIRVLDELQQRQQQLAAQLGYEPQRVITVFLCPTQQIFDRMTGGVVPHWGEAAANAEQWRIFLKTPAASDTRELLPVTVTHELAHLCLAELATPTQMPNARPNSLPRWFNEGAAILLSGEPRYSDPTLISRALLTNSIVEFDEIDDLLSFNSARAGLAYAESYHAVHFMISRFGANALRQFAQACSIHNDTRQAFQVAFNEDLWDFEVAYFDYLRQHFRWYFLLDDSFLFGAIIVILVIAGFLLTRWRARRKMKEWEDEEAPSSPEGNGEDEQNRRLPVE